jgi:hypothetical protein
VKSRPWFRELAGDDVGKYKLEAYLGAGKIGYVYRAHIRILPERQVAIKLTPSSLKPGWENELNKVFRLSMIPGVVHFHDLGTCQLSRGKQTELFQYTVWDYVHPGRNLRDYLVQVGSCSTSFFVAVIEGILRVLHACSRSGVARHGDLHAGNILIGEESAADITALLEIRAPIYVSDFGYGTTGGATQPKDDFDGLASIADDLLRAVSWDSATSTDRRIIQQIHQLISKLLREGLESERREPLEILKAIYEAKRQARSLAISAPPTDSGEGIASRVVSEGLSVGQYQVSEMLGDAWEWWKKLFVPRVPGRSRILEPDISTVVTGPRGCGKTMLFRRLSERLMIECGPVDESSTPTRFVAFYINTNDIADAFSMYPDLPSGDDQRSLVCYANLCVLSDLLAVESAFSMKHSTPSSDGLLSLVRKWLVAEPDGQLLLVGEDSLESLRTILEEVKWRFPNRTSLRMFPGLDDLARHEWLPRMFSLVRPFCSWIGNRSILLFVDDYTTPRVSISMQRSLNRLFFQRSAEYVCKVATESATTFITEDSSGKVLQDGDDFQLIDMAEESLFMDDAERASFLAEVFSKRLSLDKRASGTWQTLPGLLGKLEIGKTEFARRLRQAREAMHNSEQATGARRGATKPRVLYHGFNVFTSLWSGDTRTLIQLVQELLDEALANSEAQVRMSPVTAELQDRVFRNRGGQWLVSQTRNQPTNRNIVEAELNKLKRLATPFSFTGGSYGGHLKAVVEAFVSVARSLLLGPTYKIRSSGTIREVPRMAFRIEVVDEFRLDGLAAEIYTDLIRYGLFLRDARGKSVRGAMVPRLYLRRFLLPYCALALSKRDSVPMTCAHFIALLLTPDLFKEEYGRLIARRSKERDEQGSLFGVDGRKGTWYNDPAYEDDSDGIEEI